MCTSAVLADLNIPFQVLREQYEQVLPSSQNLLTEWEAMRHLMNRQGDPKPNLQKWLATIIDLAEQYPNLASVAELALTIPMSTAGILLS